MEKRISKGVLSAALILVTSFVCGIIAIAGFLLGFIVAKNVLRHFPGHTM